MAKAWRRAIANWCSEGVLQGYVLGSYSARKLGLKTTGNAGGTHNLLVESTVGGMEIGALMRELGTGLLVTELMGQGVNGVTGDYSRGASGYWVENGVQAYPVHEITIAGNLKEMYQQHRGDRQRRGPARRRAGRVGAHRRDDDRRRIKGTCLFLRVKGCRVRDLASAHFLLRLGATPRFVAVTRRATFELQRRIRNTCLRASFAEPRCGGR